MRPDHMEWDTMSKAERADLVDVTMAAVREIAQEIAFNLTQKAVEAGVPYRFAVEITMIPRRRSNSNSDNSNGYSNGNEGEA